MELSLTIPRDDFDVESLSAAAARLAELTGNHDHIRIRVTTEFVAGVRGAIADDPEYAAAYEQDREFAFAVAKTITQADKSIDLIVDAGIFSREADPAEALRTFEHEALHIVLGQRGETMSDLRSRRGQTRESAAGTHSAICGVACEEYRVERALWNLHPAAREHSHLAQFETLLRRFDDSVREASIKYQRDLDVEAIARAVMEAFHALCTSTAYVAAELDSDPTRGASIDPELDARLLGAPWRRAVAEFQTLPPADVEATRKDLEEIADGVSTALVEWLDHIGFSLSDEPGGALHFGVLNPEDWVSWSDLL
jgi:hypothetical protein